MSEEIKKGTLKEEKNEMREVYRQKRKELSPEEKEQRDTAVCNRIASLVSFRHADYVLMYAATEGEINIDPLALLALEKGKAVAYPKCDTENHTMCYHFVTSPEQLVPDSYGIREPDTSAPVYDPEIHTGSAVCLVPGLVFDRFGYRVGYGKGYYDRYLTAFKGESVGIVYDDFILPRVPRGRFDTRVNILLTDKKVMVTSEN